MRWREVTRTQKKEFNEAIDHPLQSFEWGDFRESRGDKVLRFGFFEDENLIKGFQIFLRPVQNTRFNVGYIPKGPILDQAQFELLSDIANDLYCVSIKLEPNIETSSQSKSDGKFFQENNCSSGYSVFSRHIFEIDLTLSEEILLGRMHPKTRYNIGLAQRKGVEVSIDNSEVSLDHFLNLLEETKKRQNFETHSLDYYRDFWQIFQASGIAYFLKASYQGETLAMAMVFVFKNRIYYPHGVSTRKNKNVMASNLLMWEMIRFGKQKQCHFFDSWSAFDSSGWMKSQDRSGVDRFLSGYGTYPVATLGTFDLLFSDAQALTV